MKTSGTQREATEQLLAMTPEDHLRVAAETLATPASTYQWTDQYLHALTHLGMATVKQGAHR